MARARVRTILGPVSINETDAGLFDWLHGGGPLGGFAPSRGIIDDGHGNLLQSGTNAPIFRSSFTLRKALSEEEEKHRERLATALDIDLSSRILPLESFETISKRLSRMKLDERIGQEKTFWNGTTWSKEGPIKRKLTSYRPLVTVLSQQAYR